MPKRAPVAIAAAVLVAATPFAISCGSSDETALTPWPSDHRAVSATLEF